MCINGEMKRISKSTSTDQIHYLLPFVIRNAIALNGREKNATICAIRCGAQLLDESKTTCDKHQAHDK